MSFFISPKPLLPLAAAALLLSLQACDRNADDRAISPNRASLYDPMRDAASDDDVPTAPSVSGVTPDQAMGGGSAGVMIPGNAPVGASLGALGGGRR